MTRFLFASLLASSILLMFSSSSDAQYRFGRGGYRYGGGVGIGVGVGTGGLYGPYVGPTFGIFPTYYDGFYGNGFSAYGPPVPTYASIPGVFGGIDQKNYGIPSHFFGLGWFGYRSPSPRLLPNFDYQAPGKFIREPILEEEAPRSLPMYIEVKVPEEATVMIDGKETKQTGPTRVFGTPPLSTAEKFSYEIRASWMVEGQLVTRLRAASGRGGDRVIVDFTSSK
jgi:uncharacterized protein (TIGR03000 family)